ncbi:MAG TPA: HEAT repeat domain-containing protein [Candidatus Polarisedimenticolia bacterium]
MTGSDLLQHSLKTLLLPPLLIVSITPVPAARDTDVSFTLDDSVRVDDDSDWARMMAGLDHLQNGAPREARKVADEADGLFAPLEFPAAQHEGDVNAVVDALRQVIRLDADDWVTTRLLSTLSTKEWVSLERIFREALDSSSVNVRRQGIRWYMDHKDPDALPVLEDALRHEERPWVLSDLIEALANQGAPGHLEDFMKAAKSDDPGIAFAGIRALGRLADAGAIPLLAKIARRGSVDARFEALGALTSWPGDPEALEIFLEATHAEESLLRTVAVEGLSRFKDSKATQRLIEMTDLSQPGSLRVAAMKCLEERGGREVVDALLEVLRTGPGEPDASVVPVALRILHNIDDPSALPILLSLRPALSEQGEKIDPLIAYLSRDRDKESPEQIVTISSSCGSAPNPDDPETLRIIPPSGWGSVRCWEAPDVPGDPDESERLSAGTLARISDDFESPDGLWVSSEQHGFQECWIPRRYLGDSGGGSPSGKITPDDPFLLEFDLPTDEFRTPAAARLFDLGLLEEFDPAGEVAAARLRVDPANRKEVSLLAGTFVSGPSILDGQIRVLAVRLLPLFKDDRDLAPALQSILNRAARYMDDF